MTGEYTIQPFFSIEDFPLCAKIERAIENPIALTKELVLWREASPQNKSKGKKKSKRGSKSYNYNAQFFLVLLSSVSSRSYSHNSKRTKQTDEATRREEEKGVEYTKAEDRKGAKPERLLHQLKEQQDLLISVDIQRTYPRLSSDTSVRRHGRISTHCPSSRPSNTAPRCVFFIEPINDR